MGITIEVTEVGVLVAIICVLLLALVWLFLSKRREIKEIKESQTSTKIATPKVNKKKKHKDVTDSEDSHSDNVSEDDYYYQLREACRARRRQHILQQPAVPQPIIVQPTVIELPKRITQVEKLLQTAHCISHGSPSVYKIPVDDTKKVTAGIEKVEVGTPHPTSKPTRVFMAVGVTGAGKSTLINGMVNYLMGVKFEDECRFKLITDEVAQSQAHNQAQKITSYTIYWHEESPVDYNLIIVDTPGFRDTWGIEQNKQITAQIKNFFSLKGDAGIDQIHGIGFVTQSQLPRLTQTQKYAFNSVLSVFGKDVKNNIFIMATFADGNEPAVKGAIKEAKIPYCNFLQFDNKYLLLVILILVPPFGKWLMRALKIFSHFTRTETVSLQLTRAVLKE